MKIQANENLKRSFYRKYYRETRKAFIKCRQQLMELAPHTDPERLKTHVNRLLQSKPMKDNLQELWSKVGGRYGYDTERMIKKGKSAVHSYEMKDSKDQLKLWEDRMRTYSAERSLKITESIMTVEEEAINKVIDGVIERTLSEGLGVLQSRSAMIDALENELTEIESWQAQRIAMTEVGSAQNTASFDAAQENAEGVRKEWLFIPGIKTFRDNHQGFEAMGPQDMDFDYAEGLKFPGDPDCQDPSEVINCYCSIIYEVD